MSPVIESTSFRIPAFDPENGPAPTSSSAYRLAQQIHRPAMHADLTTQFLVHSLPGGLNAEPLIAPRVNSLVERTGRAHQAWSALTEIYDEATLQTVAQAYGAGNLRDLHEKVARIYVGARLSEDLGDGVRLYNAIGLRPRDNRAFGAEVPRTILVDDATAMHWHRAQVFARVAWGAYRDVEAKTMSLLTNEVFYAFEAGELVSLLSFALTPAGIQWHQRRCEFDTRETCASERPEYRAGLAAILSAVVGSLLDSVLGKP